MREFLAIVLVYGMDRFHQYTHGRLIEVHTDQKPLEMIFLKPLQETSQRLQRMLMRLQRYHMRVIYKRGRERLIADTLFRVSLPHRNVYNDCPAEVFYTHFQFEENLELLEATTSSFITPGRLQDIALATAQDETSQSLCTAIFQGWHDSKQLLPPRLRIRLYHIALPRSASCRARRDLLGQAVCDSTVSPLIHIGPHAPVTHRNRRLHSKSQRMHLLA